jgi:hypothetical protein
MPNIAFDPGHGPQSNPSSHRLYPIAHPPLIARLGPCRSMPALGTSGKRGAVDCGTQGVFALVHVGLVLQVHGSAGPPSVPGANGPAGLSSSPLEVGKRARFGSWLIHRAHPNDRAMLSRQ